MWKIIKLTFPGSSKVPTRRLLCRGILQSHRISPANVKDTLEEFPLKSENREVKENRQTRKEVFHRFHLPHAHIDNRWDQRETLTQSYKSRGSKRENFAAAFSSDIKGNNLTHTHTLTRIIAVSVYVVAFECRYTRKRFFGLVCQYGAVSKWAIKFMYEIVAFEWWWRVTRPSDNHRLWRGLSSDAREWRSR